MRGYADDRRRGRGDGDRDGAARAVTAGSDGALLAGGGEMGERIRAFDWASTPLGPIETWPQSLRSAVSLILGGASPLAVYWGSDLILLYNDPWRALIGEKHPHALGRPARDVFPEIWDALRPMFEKVMSGRGPAERRNHLLRLDRGRGLEDTWFDYSFNPIPREDGSVGGVFNIPTETSERVCTERALRESEERLKLAAQTASFGVYDADLAAGELYWSPELKRILGLPPDAEEPAPGRAHGFVHPDDAAPVRQLIEKAYDPAGAGLVEHEHRIVRTDGEVRWVLLKGRVSFASEGQERHPVRSTGVMVDVTERKQAEEALRQYAQRLEFLQEMDEVMLRVLSREEVAQVVVDHACRLLSCRRASVALHDREARELVRLAFRSADEGGPASGWGPVDSDWNQVVKRLRGGEGYLIEDVQALEPSTPLIAQAQAEGVRAYVYEPIVIRGELAGSLNLGLADPGPPPPDRMAIIEELGVHLAVGLEQARLYEEVQRHVGRLERLAGSLEQLVTERTRELQASEARFRTIFEEAAIGIALTGYEGELVAANPALHQMLGYGEEELEGRRLFDVLNGAAVAGRALFQSLAETGAREVAAELGYTRRDGEEGYANMTLSLLSNEGDRPWLILALVEDMTEQKRAHRMLIEAERLTAMGRMGASLAHEINNPLQSVIGCLGLAMEAQEAGEDPDELMDVALEELKRAAAIVHRMRDISRPGDEETELGRVGDVVSRVLTVTRKQAENQDVRVVWNGADDLPPVPMVRDQVQQVFLNLVLNAIDAMPEGGELRIEAERTEEPPGVAVSFSDTGVGIAPQERERLFTAFQSNKKEGLGLGLYVSRAIVHEHGGEIAVESEVGEGTTFRVWLPEDGPVNENLAKVP